MRYKLSRFHLETTSLTEPCPSAVHRHYSCQTIAGLNTYTVGPADTKKIVIYVYDIVRAYTPRKGRGISTDRARYPLPSQFGVTPQALQGADLIASSGVKVWIPDFLHGWAADHDRISGPDRYADPRSSVLCLLLSVDLASPPPVTL